MTNVSDKILPLPPHYRPEHAGQWGYRPDAQRLLDEAAAWRREHAIRPSGDDRRTVHLLLIDAQKDFCHPEGTLYVGGRSGSGAIDDNRRTAEFIYRHLPRLTRITTTLDTHFAHQIFFASFWLDRDGRPPQPHREVTAAQIADGELRPNPAVASWVCDGDVDSLRRQAEHYCRELERVGKYRLYLWPPHCLLGGDGHPLVGAIQEARLFHAYARAAQSECELKGGHPLTENYSVLRPEVLTRADGGALAEPNRALMATLLAADVVVVAGQAASHCVLSTMDDLLDGIRAVDAKLARKVHVLTDCMSAVAVPDGKGGFVADFTPQAEAAQARWAEAGCVLTTAERFAL